MKKIIFISLLTITFISACTAEAPTNVGNQVEVDSLVEGEMSAAGEN